MAQIITFLLELQDNVRLFHWMTKSYAKHKASDELYAELNGLVDKFVEVWIAKYGRPKFAKNKMVLNVKVVVGDDLTGLIDVAIAFLTKMKETDVALLSIRDDMVIALNQAKYLMTLS